MCKIVIACDSLKKEIELVVKNLNISPNIIWIDSKLHNTPTILKKELQEKIDSCYSDVILLLYGCCGNATVGLASEKSKLVCLKVDDCISLLLGGNENRKNLRDSMKSYFFTKTQIENECSLFNEIKNCINKRGEEKTKKIYDMMLKHYEYIRVIDTGAYKIEDIIDKSKYISDNWNMKHEVIEGDLNILYKAFSEDWDDNFIQIEGRNHIDLNQFL